MQLADFGKQFSQELRKIAILGRSVRWHCRGVGPCNVAFAVRFVSGLLGEFAGELVFVSTVIVVRSGSII